MRVLRWAALAAGSAFAVSANANGIVVNYVGTVPAAAETAFNSVVSAYNAMFTIDFPVVIDVQFNTTSLGSSSTYIGETTYASWRAQMIADSTAHPWNSYLAAAIKTLPATDPIGNGYVELTFADAEALGYSVPAEPYDSLITFSKNVTFEYNGVAASGAYDFKDVAEHELDEALGIGSALTGIANGGSLPSTYFAEDYFRYSSSGSRLLTTSSTAAVYFSYNGTTDVAKFNQNNADGDRNDWAYADGNCPALSPGPYIQDAIGCTNSAVILTIHSPESIVLQSLGYDLPAPEPASAALLAGGLAIVVLLRRRLAR